MRGGHYQAFVAEQGSLGDFVARQIGLGVKVVTISGAARLSEREILDIAGVSPKSSIPFFDVDAAKAKLEKAPLVASASVRKLYPNRLVVDLVERAPVALWQRSGEVSIVAADGAALDELKDARLNDLPFVVGTGANKRLKEYLALLDAAEELRAKIEAGVFISERRWNLHMKTGVEVKLPEIDPRLGDAGAFETGARVAHSRARHSFARLAPAWARLRPVVGRRRRSARAKIRRQTEESGQDVSGLSLTPRLKPLHPRKSAVLAVLDVGGSKVVCLIARLLPMERGATLRGRTHRCKVIGLGQQKARGVKGGAIVDLEAAESAIRLAVDAAERMAGVEVESVIVNMSGGRLAARTSAASVGVQGAAIGDAETA